MGSNKFDSDAIKTIVTPFFWIFYIASPTILFVYAASESHIRMKRYQARCTWMPVFAGPLLVFGDFSCRFSGFSLWGHNEKVFAANSLIDMGAFCLMQAALITFTRLVYYTQPPVPNAVFQTPRFVRVGYVLLGLSGAVVLFLFWPLQRYYAPHLTFPFCVYLMVIHLIKKRQIAEGARLKQQTTPLGPKDPGQWAGLFSATWRMSIILTARSVYGMWAAHTGDFHKSEGFHMIGNDLLLLLCYLIFNRNHPGMYLPRELTVGLYHGQEKEKDVPSSVRIPLESV